jgi:mitogen-activated protein kinase organizer 1
VSNRAPDNATFTSCGQEKDVYLWDVSAGHVIRKFSGHYGRINVVKFSGSVNPGQKNSGSSVIFSGSFDAKVMVWDVRSQGRSPIQTLQESRDSVTSIDTSPGGVEVVVGSVDGTVRTYDLRMGKKVEDVIAGEFGQAPGPD